MTVPGPRGEGGRIQRVRKWPRAFKGATNTASLPAAERLLRSVSDQTRGGGCSNAAVDSVRLIPAGIWRRCSVLVKATMTKYKHHT